MLKFLAKIPLTSEVYTDVNELIYNYHSAIYYTTRLIISIVTIFPGSTSVTEVEYIALSLSYKPLI